MTPDPASIAGAFLVPPVKRGGTREHPAVHVPEEHARNARGTEEQPSDLPLWARNAIMAKAQERAFRAFLKARRDAGLEERHRIKLGRTRTAMSNAPTRGGR